MCGFVGVMYADASTPVDRETFEGLLRWLRHRGPDGEDVHLGPGVGLAACRLSVQGDERARQPLRSRDGRFVVAFNGEILGPRREMLRAAVSVAGLEVPSEGAGDGPLLTEAVAALGRGFGELEEPHLRALLEGSMGALVVLDQQTDDVWLMRDRLGIKPLHVLDGDEGTWWASELRPLLVQHPEARTVSPAGLADLLHWHRPARHLPFAGVQSLGPGAVWRIRRGGRKNRWAGGNGIRDLEDRDRLEPEEAVYGLLDALRRSAEAAAATEGPASLLLSGGLDSGAVALLAGRADLLAITGRYAPSGGDLDESAAAAAVAAEAGLDHEVLDLRDADLLTDLPAVVEALELPLAGPGALALWRTLKAARTHGRVVLTGTGGDELLGGYVRTALVLGRSGPWTVGYEPLARRLDAVGAEVAARHREVLDRSGDLRPFLSSDFLSTLPAAGLPGSVARDGVSGGDVAALLVAEEIEGTLPMLLHVEDRMAMAHGVEGRPVPCLLDVPAAAARLPTPWLIGPDGEGKRALRAALRGIMPEAVRTDPRKRGFPTPFARAACGQARTQALAVIEDRRFRERGWWNVDACRASLDEARPVHDRALYALLSWELWARAHLDGDAFGREPTA